MHQAWLDALSVSESYPRKKVNLVPTVQSRGTVPPTLLTNGDTSGRLLNVSKPRFVTCQRGA